MGGQGLGAGRLSPSSQERGMSAIGCTGRGGASSPVGIRLYGCTWVGTDCPDYRDPREVLVPRCWAQTPSGWLRMTPSLMTESRARLRRASVARGRAPDGLTRAAVPAQPARQPRPSTTTIECKDTARPDPATITLLPTRAEAPTLKPCLCSAEPRTTARVLGCGAMQCLGRARSRNVASDPDWGTGPC